MRCTAILLFLLPIFSCSQVKKFVQESQANIREKEEQEQLNLRGEDITGFHIGCMEQSATVDSQIWENYLKSNLVLDDASLDTIPAGNYTVFVQFVIDKEGKIGDASINKDPGYGLGQKVVKTISGYKGLWKPALSNGRLILSYRLQPVTFIVEEEKEECEDEFRSELIL